MKEAADYVSLPGLRTRTVTHREVQTEATFIPSCVDLKYAYEEQASEQFSQLCELRQVIEGCMRQLAGHVYDVVSFKDVMFKHEEDFPTSFPVTDMLLLSSKLYRTTCELARMLGCFFGVIFADEHSDEHFHFTEVRLLQKELLQVKKQLRESEEERAQLRQTLKNVGQLALNHGKAVEVLEGHNHALKLQTSALEDQMALLFQQLNTDLEVNCKENFTNVVMEMKRQECLSSARTAFRQTIENLCDQIRGARSLTMDVRTTLMSCNQGMRTGEAYLAVEPAIRYKLKTLDNNLQQLFLRFNAMKETVAETTQELFNAMNERKRILHLSLQHIRLYDLQSKKFRTAKAILSKLSATSATLLQRVQATFPGGAITSVDRIGYIITRQWHGGYTLASLQRQKMEAALANASAPASPKGGEPDAGGGGGGGGGPTPPPRQPSLPREDPLKTMRSFTEAERMAVESELAALGDPAVLSRMEGAGGGRPAFRDSLVSARGGEGGGELPPPLLPPPPTAGEEGGGPAAEPFPSLQAMFALFQEMGGDIAAIQSALALQDETAAFLTALTRAAATTAREDPSAEGGDLAGRFLAASDGSSRGYSFIEHYERVFESALIPTATGGGGAPSSRGPAGGLSEADKWGPDGSAEVAATPPTREGLAAPDKTPIPGKEGKHSAMEKAQANSMLARQAQQLQYQQEVLYKMQEDFSLKLDFLRQVYEGRITDLEVKESSLEKIWGAGEKASAEKEPRGGSASSIRSSSTSRWRPSLSMDPEKAGAGSNSSPGGRLTTPAGNPGRLNRDRVVATRSAWRENMRKVSTTEKLRKATMDALDRVEQRTKENSIRKQAKGG